MYAKMNISSRNYTNHNERDLITASTENHAEGIEFLLRLNQSNRFRFEAFEAALKAQNWAAVAALVKNGVLHGPKNLSTRVFGIFTPRDIEKGEYLEQIIQSILEATKNTEMSSENLQGFRTLLFELAKLDTSLRTISCSRASEYLGSLTKFNADAALNHRYFHLFGAAGFAFAKPVLSGEIANHLIRFHFMSTVHGVNSYADGLVLQLPQGKKLVNGAQEYLQSYLEAVSTNKDGCRDLFFEIAFRLAYGVSGNTLNESVKSELYSRKKFVEKLFAEQDCKVFAFEILSDDTGEKKKADHTQYVSNGSTFDLVTKGGTGFTRI